jgi:uncharacterized protein DUF3485
MTFQRWWFYIVLALVVAGTVSAALYDRNSEEKQEHARDAAAEAVLATPNILGSWRAIEEHALEEPALRMLQCTGYINRVYQNQQNGQLVSVAVFVGPAGPLVAHTPDVCMTSQQFEPIGGLEQMTLSVNDQTHQFIRTMFQERTLEGNRLAVYYAWSPDGQTWQAPTSPRLPLGPLPLLYKIQVGCSSAAESEDKQSSPSQHLLRELIPALAKNSAKVSR